MGYSCLNNFNLNRLTLNFAWTKFMHPELFKFQLPEFLQGLYSEEIIIYSYGFLISLGALFAFLYTATQAKKQFDVPFHQSADIAILLILAAVVGGKIFFFFEDPIFFIKNPGEILKSFENGFVFFGSLLFCIPTMLIYFKSKKLPILPMLDIMAVTTCIVHGFGRMGCLMAGCCYGLPHDGFASITFHHPASLANPLNTPLHPTQLYSITLISIILIYLLYLKSNKSFQGQVFLTYLILYATGRSFIEIFRGDISRGFIIENYLSHSQFISVLVILSALYFYWNLKRKEIKKG